MAPLYILHLGGSVVDIGLIATLYNFMLIPASMFWGSMTDRLARRRLFFVIASTGTMVIFLIMYLLPSIAAFAALYGLLALVIGANSTASNLLVMETTEKKNWISSYGRLSLVANTGATLGLAVGFIWSATLPFDALLLFASGSTALSVVLSFFLVPEPELTLESSQLAFHPLGYASRVYHGMASVVQHLVLTPPSPKEVLRALRATRAGAMTGKALLFFSTFFFTIASALMNTAYTPFLSEYGVSDSQIFALSLINVATQTLAYRGVGGLIQRFGGVKAGSYSIIVRAAFYMLMAFAALAFRGFGLFVVGTLLFVVIGIAYAIWNASTSVLLFSNLGEARQGNLLGGYAALSNLGTVVGAFLTGYISYYDGFATTFAISAAVMLVSFFVLEASLRRFGYVTRGGEEEASK
jgi:MFS family permease